MYADKRPAFLRLRNDVRWPRSERPCIAILRTLGQDGDIRRRPIRSRPIRWVQIGLIACVIAAPTLAVGAELRPEAADAFDRYVRLTEKRMRTELQPGQAFLWVDGLAEARRDDIHAQLQRGEVVSARLKTPDTGGEFRTPGALIHHWVGTVFIPGASLRRALATVEDYDRHSQYFSPEVAKSKTLEHTGDDFKVYLRLTRKKIVTVVLDTEYEVHYESLGDGREQSRSYSTRIAEVAHPGEADERQVPPGKEGGYLWRLNSYWRFYETRQGVYVQCEAVSLTRDIPAGLGWLIGPFIESIPRESLEFTLRSTRAAVLGENSRAAHEGE